MGSSREFNFTTGIETSTLPSAGTPTVDDDLVTKGFTDGNYVQGAAAVATKAALKAVAEADRKDNDLRLVDAENFLWKFDAASAAADDGDAVLEPDVGTGRWIKTSASGGTPVATEDTTGTVTSFIPVIKSSVHTVSSANYTVLDDDGYKEILVTTGASDRTITLPTAADNEGRLLTIKKVDSGVGGVIIDGESSETIDDALTITVPLQYDYMQVACDASDWYVVNVKGSSNWVSFTPTGDFNTNTTYTGYYRRVGDTMDVRYRLTFSGAPNTTILDLDVPLGLTIDTGKVTDSSTGDSVGNCYFFDSSGSFRITGHALINDSTSVRPQTLLDSSGVNHAARNIEQNAPEVIASGDEIYVTISIPILEWDNM